MSNMSILSHHQRGTITTTLGTVSENISVGNSICHQILVVPTTSNTNYDVTLTDIYGNVVYTREDIVGELNDVDTGLLTYGNWTLTIENASNNEDFTYLVTFRQQ